MIEMNSELSFIVLLFCITSTGCLEVPIYDHTIVVSNTGHLHKDTITFACTPGYNLIGDPTIMCKGNGMWSKRRFTCEGNFHVLSTNCMFLQ